VVHFGVFPDRRRFGLFSKILRITIRVHGLGGKMNTPLEILNGWKEISRYLKTSVRSVQKYERLAGLPVRRPTGRSRGAVLATKTELDAWVNASVLKKEFSLRPRLENSVAFESLKKGLAAQHQLRQEMMRSRDELNSAVELLHTTLGAFRDEAAQRQQQWSRETLFVTDSPRTVWQVEPYRDVMGTLPPPRET
jgi:hypothetical protein